MITRGCTGLLRQPLGWRNPEMAGGPEQWLTANAQPTSAEVTLAQLRMPELTIADIERAEVDSLKYRYE